MIRIETVGDAWKVYVAAMGDLISGGIKQLLSEKHLYQSITLDDDVARGAVRPIPDRIKQRCEELGTWRIGTSQYAWQLKDDLGEQRPEDNRPGVDFVRFALPHAKIYCVHCKTREVFNPLSGSSTIRIWEYNPPLLNKVGTIFQVYSLVYLCQNCRKFPETFLVRREGGKLRLCGRSQMEQAEVPAEIPESMREHYSGAVVAYQSGQVLPANFMLRVSIEQWMRRWADNGDKSEIVQRKYMESLPEGFSDKFPSLPAVYSSLSEDIHAATGSRQVYEQAVSAISKHFKARLIYPDVSAPPK